jgi:hypothetical protein
MPQMLDSFSDHFTLAVNTDGWQTHYQYDPSILGGRRHINFKGDATFNLTTHIDITKGYIHLSPAAEQWVRLELQYGGNRDRNVEKDDSYPEERWLGNFDQMGNALRINFHWGDRMSVNFNTFIRTEPVSLHYAPPRELEIPPLGLPHGGHAGTNARVIDILFDEFGRDINLSRVLSVGFVFQTSSDFSIDSIEIVGPPRRP